MAAYGNGQMLGSGINPESFKQDYSGFTRAAATQAQGIANLGENIGGVINDYSKQKADQKKVDALNKASAKSIEAALTLGKSYGVAGAEETLRPFLESYNDPSLSPIEKAALLEEGKAMIPNVFGRFDKSQSVNLQEKEIGIRDALNLEASNAKKREFEAKANQRIPGLEPFGNGHVSVNVDGFGNKYDPKTGRLVTDMTDFAIGGDNFGPRSEGGPLPAPPTGSGSYGNANMPTGSGSTQNTVLPDSVTRGVPNPPADFNYNQLPALTGEEVVDPAVVANIAAAGPQTGLKSRVIPKSAEKPPAPVESVEIVTGEKAKSLGLLPEDSYKVKFKDGKVVDYEVLVKAPTAPTVTADQKKEQESSLRAVADAAYAISTINKLATSSGFSDVFGAGIGLRFVPGSEAFDADIDRQAIVELATGDAIKKFQGLGSMSDAEFNSARRSATKLANSGLSEEKAAEELNRLRSFFADSVRRAENLGKIPKGTAEKAIGEAMSNLPSARADAPMTESERLRVMRTGY